MVVRPAACRIHHHFTSSLYFSTSWHLGGSGCSKKSHVPSLSKPLRVNNQLLRHSLPHSQHLLMEIGSSSVYFQVRHCRSQKKKSLPLSRATTAIAPHLSQRHLPSTLWRAPTLPSICQVISIGLRPTAPARAFRWSQPLPSTLWTGKWDDCYASKVAATLLWVGGQTYPLMQARLQMSPCPRRLAPKFASASFGWTHPQCCFRDLSDPELFQLIPPIHMARHCLPGWRGRVTHATGQPLLALGLPTSFGGRLVEIGHHPPPQLGWPPSA